MVCTYKILSCWGLIVLALCLCVPGAQAQCVPGLPCVTDLTPNDPYDLPIDPNDSGPNASKTDGDMCDADFMNQIYARAWLEAERENIIAEVLLTKPDSVMEYSCFEQMNSITAVKGGPLFSENDEWWDTEITIDGGMGDHNPTWEDVDTRTVYVHMCDGVVPCDKLDKSIKWLVLEALKDYADTNFFHDFVGGRIQGMNNDITGLINNFYLCDYINLIHFRTKCNNLFESSDEFFSFETLMGLDPRLLPEQCPDGTAITQGEIDVAENKDFPHAYFDKLSDIYTGKMDVDLCSAPVPTGVKIRKKNVVFETIGGGNTFVTWEEYDEHVCINPGCRYTPGGGCQ